jgi:hypothetical protein
MIRGHEIRYWVKEDSKEEIDSTLMHKNFSLSGLPATKIRTIGVSKFLANGKMSSKELAREYEQIYSNTKNDKEDEFVKSILQEEVVSLMPADGLGSQYVDAWFSYNKEMSRTWGLIKIDSLHYHLACTAAHTGDEELLFEVFELPDSVGNALCLVHQIATKGKRMELRYRIYEYDPKNNPGRLVYREEISDWVKKIKGTDNARKFILDTFSKGIKK